MSINLEATAKKKKRDLLLEFDILDVFSEENRVYEEDKVRMRDIKAELDSIWKREEIALW